MRLLSGNHHANDRVSLVGACLLTMQHLVQCATMCTMAMHRQDRSLLSQKKKKNSNIFFFPRLTNLIALIVKLKIALIAIITR